MKSQSLEDVRGRLPDLEIAHLEHRYGNTVALRQLSLSVAAGEFLTILGPSGSGKTTLLRIIGGFEQASSVEVLRIGQGDMRGLPANHRPVATVFQHYALFPHMNVEQNVGYGLKLRKIPPAERRERVDKALGLVRLDGKAQRQIQQLSGGEKQRVAFARAFVTEPRLLLLDEPMGALDEKLRHDMQIEVRNLQRTLGTTFIQVTHSKEEALTMSDRIVVMNQGQIEQIGTPQEIFERPSTRFVAEFMGLTNLLEGPVIDVQDAAVTIALGNLHLNGHWCGKRSAAVGCSAFYAVHPAHIQLGGDAPAEAILLAGIVTTTLYRGSLLEVTLDTPVGPMVATVPPLPLRTGDRTTLWWQPTAGICGQISNE